MSSQSGNSCERLIRQLKKFNISFRRTVDLIVDPQKYGKIHIFFCYNRANLD